MSVRALAVAVAGARASAGAGAGASASAGAGAGAALHRQMKSVIAVVQLLHLIVRCIDRCSSFEHVQVPVFFKEATAVTA